jgi:hypothetical protein
MTRVELIKVIARGICRSQCGRAKCFCEREEVGLGLRRCLAHVIYSDMAVGALMAIEVTGSMVAETQVVRDSRSQLSDPA